MSDVPTISAAEIAAEIVRRLPRVPLTDQLWDAEEVATYLRIKPRTMEELKRRPGFPAARRPTESDRWVAAEIIAWAKQQYGKVPRGRRAA